MNTWNSGIQSKHDYTYKNQQRSFSGWDLAGMWPVVSKAHATSYTCGHMCLPSWAPGLHQPPVPAQDPTKAESVLTCWWDGAWERARSLQKWWWRHWHLSPHHERPPWLWPPRTLEEERCWGQTQKRTLNPTWAQRSLAPANSTRDTQHKGLLERLLQPSRLKARIRPTSSPAMRPQSPTYCCMLILQVRNLQAKGQAQVTHYTMPTPEPSPRLPKPICDLSRTVHGCPPSQHLLQSLRLVLTFLSALHTRLPCSPHFLWHCLGIAMVISGWPILWMGEAELPVSPFRHRHWCLLSLCPWSLFSLLLMWFLLMPLVLMKVPVRRRKEAVHLCDSLSLLITKAFTLHSLHHRDLICKRLLQPSPR